MMKHSTAARKLTASLLSAALTAQLMLTVPQVSAAEKTDLEAFCTRIRQAWESHETNSISLTRYNLTVAEATDAYYEMLYTDADWIDVASRFRYSETNGKMSSLTVQYNYSEELYTTNRLEFDAKVAEIIAGISPQWSDAEKVLYLHDYLAERCVYDLSFQATSYNAYSALVTGTAVCQGYALAMCVLCRELGIPCYTATYRTTTEQGTEDNHMWCVVELDGSWYHVDPTFDDSVPDMLGHSMHQYLLQSDAVMLADGVHKTADTWGYFAEGREIVCDSDRYADAFWVDALDTVQPLADGTWLYAMRADYSSIRTPSDIKATLCRSSLTGGTEELGSYSAKWRTPGGSYYMDCYISSQYFGDKIYFHTENAICALSPESGTVETVCTLTADQSAQGDIYGFTIDDTGLLTYQVMHTLDFTGSDYAKDIYFYTLQLDSDVPPAPETTTAPPVTTSTSAAAVTTSAATTAAQTTAAQTTAAQTTAAQTTTAQTTAAQTTAAQTTAAQTTAAQTTAAQTTAAQTTAATTVTTTVTTPAPTTAAPTETTAAASAETATTASAAPITGLCGDVTGDGAVDVADAVLLARLLLADPTAAASQQGLANADCDGNGVLETDDVIWIVRFIAGLIEL